MTKRPASLLVAATATGLLLLAGLALSGALSLITTHGVSMEPRFHTGDLAVVRETADPRVGDVVAYRSRQLRTVVLHRIVGRDGDRYVFKGDHNTWLDSERPSRGDLVGVLVLRIPGGGRAFGWLTQPAAIAMAVFALLAGGGAASRRRRRRGGRLRRATQGQDGPVTPETAPPIPRPAAAVRGWAGLPTWLRAAAAGSAVTALAALALGAAAWTRPVETLDSVPDDTARQLTFSYSARLRPSAAYPSGTVSSPDPVFRTLAESVDVRLDYQGPPGVITVTALLSTRAGWRTQIPLLEPSAFDAPRLSRTVRLDLAALDARVQAATAALRMPLGEVGIGIAATVRDPAGAAFAPRLDLKLTPGQLALAGDPGSLAVKDRSPGRRPVQVARTVNLLVTTVSVARARPLSVGLLLAALAAGAIVLVVAARTAPVGEGAAIRRRYASLLVEVRPRPTPPGWSVVDVTGFAALAKLAARYEDLVLHWSDQDGETFVVQEDGTVYRYCCS
jgi:signal peptidase I